jgi:hypothetical protein
MSGPRRRARPVGGAHGARALLQHLDRQPPDRTGNADGADDLAAEIAHWQREAEFGYVSEPEPRVKAAVQFLPSFRDGT